jgi:hypothetical protein
MIALSRSSDIELLSTVKQPRSFNGLKLFHNDMLLPDLSNLKGAQYREAMNKLPATVAHFNVIPIKLVYQLDIYTKTTEEADEYIRTFLFKLINNPVIKIKIPYNDIQIEHIANLRVLPTVSDNSSISERIFSGQFSR